MADQVIGRLVYEVTQIGLAQLKRELEDLTKKPLKITPEVTSEGKRALSEIDNEMRRLRNRVTGLRNEFAASGGDINRYTQNLKAAQREALELAKSHDRSSRAFVHLTGTAASAQRGIVSALRAQAMAVTPLQEQIARLQNQVHGLRNQYIATGGPSDQFAARMRRVRDEALRAAQGLATTSKEFRQLQTVAAQAERAAVQAMGGMSRLGLASQVRAGMSGFFGPGGVGRVMASGIGIMPGIVGQTAYFTSIFARDLGRLNAVTATATAGTLALAGAMATGTIQAARLQQQQRLLEAITRESAGAYNELTRGILDLSTKVPVTTRALFEAAEEAAKLGVDGAQNILAFTEAIQGLAFVTRGDVGTLASEVAKFMNELGIGPTSANYLDELDGVANALAAVHVWSAATADETISLSRYFAAIAAQVGLTAPQIISLSGSLAALGGQAQSSGTNLSKFFLDMARAADQGGARLQGMAEIAGMTTREFRDLVRSDIVEAFLRIARGLNEAHGSARDFARAMDMIGAENMRLIRVLGQASVGQETFLTILERVNEAQREKNYLDNVLADATNNLIDQTRLLFQTLSAVLAIMGEPVVEQLTERVKSLRESVDELYRRFDSLNDEQLRAIAIAGELVLGVVGMTVAFAALNSIVGIVMSGFRTLISIGSFVFGPTILWIAGITTAVVLLRRGWEENWFGMRDAATNAMEAVRAKWESVKTFFVGRDVAIPPAGPGLQGEWSTARVGGLAGFALPSLTIPDWSATIDTAREEASRAWQRVRRFFGFEDEEPPTLPEIESPNWEEDIDDSRLGAERAWARVKGFFTSENLQRLELPSVKVPDWADEIDAGRLRMEESWSRLTENLVLFEWPEIAPVLIPPIETSPFFESWQRFQQDLQNLEQPEVPVSISGLVEKITTSLSEAPAVKATVQIADIVTQYREGEITLQEAINEAMNRDVSIALSALTALVLPIPWPLKVAAATIALVPWESLTVEGITEFARNAWQEIQTRLRNFFRRPSEIESIVVDLARTEFAELDEMLGDVDLSSFMLRLGMTESGLQNVANAASSATGEFQLLAATRATLEELLGPVNWEDRTERIRASFHWLRMGVESEMGTIQAAAERLGIDLEEALHLWWVVGGPRLAGMQDLSEIATMGVTAAEILRRRMEQVIPETPAFDLMATIESLPFTIAEWRLDLDPAEGGESILEAIGRWMGRATPHLAAGATALGVVVGRDVAVPFVTGFVRGLNEGIRDLVWGATGITETVEGLQGELAEAQRRRDEVLSETFDLMMQLDLSAEDLAERLVDLSEAMGLFGEEGFSELLDHAERLNDNIAGMREEIERIATEQGMVRELGFLERLWKTLLSSPARNPESPWYLQDFWTLMGTIADRFRGSFYHGGIIPGTSGPDQFLAMVAPGEAIVPAKEVQRGWPAVLEWFRRQGVPGFQDGKPPLFGAQTQTALDYANLVVKEAQATSSLRDTIREVASVVQLLGSILEQGGKTIFGEDFYNEATAFLSSLWEALGIVTGRTPLRPTATLTVPSEATEPTPEPEVTRTLWQRFLEWLRSGWKSVLDQADAFELAWADATALATAGIQSFAQSLETSESAIMRWVSGLMRSIRFTPEGGFDLRSTIMNVVTNAVSFISGEVGNLISISADALKAQSAGFQRIGPGEDVLSIRETFDAMRRAEENRMELDRKYEDLAKQHRTISERTIGGAAGGGIVGGLLGAFFGPIGILIGAGLGATAGGMTANQAAKQALADQMNLTKQEIAELERSLDGYVQRLREALGLTANNFASAVQRAFSAATFDDFEDGMGRTVAGFKTQLTNAVNDIIRGALVQRFIADVVATPVSELADMVFEQIASGAEPDMDAVQRTIEDIQDRAQPFYEMLERLGLAGNTASEALNRITESLINVPSVFKRALRQFQASEGIPGLASGGYVPATPGGRIVRLGEGGEGEWVIPDSKMGGRTVLVHVDMRESTFVGDADFERRVKRIVANAFEEAASVQYG